MCNISAIGCWGYGFSNWHELSALLTAETSLGNNHLVRQPKTEIIPPNERRRAPLLVKIAIESSWQATQMAALDPTELACVFVSSFGDTSLTDYMCKVLSGEQKQLSPTKFHNSVHNAAAGYWTISTGCMQAANSISAFENSVSLALLEAMIQSVSEQKPILITFYDIPIVNAQKTVFPNANEQIVSVSLIIEPFDEHSTAPALDMRVLNTSATWPSLKVEDHLQACYQKNPVAKIFVLLKMLAEEKAGVVTLPLSVESSIQLSMIN
jgi:hypothetical protein